MRQSQCKIIAKIRKMLAKNRQFRIEDESSSSDSLAVFSNGLGCSVDSVDGCRFLIANGIESYLNSEFNEVDS